LQDFYNEPECRTVEVLVQDFYNEPECRCSIIIKSSITIINSTIKMITIMMIII
jgi:hypothetical protein